MALSFGSAVSLKGPKGDPGQAGSQIYQAAGTPSSTLGVSGDYFFATDTYTLYQKDDSGWPDAGTVLRGAKGDMGVTGVTGASFLSGAGNPSTVTFPTPPNDGDLYLDLAAGEIYKHVAGSWADQGYSIKGPAGADGLSVLVGNRPPDDSQGVDGEVYLDWTTGFLYPPKTDGAWAGNSYTSLKGQNGEDGQNGQDGLRGSQIYTGSGAPSIGSFPDAAAGDLYFDTASGNYYVVQGG